MNIQIKYSDKLGVNAGCMTVQMPGWLDESSGHQRKFYRLAAQHADEFDNRQQIALMRDCILQAIDEAKKDVEKAEAGERTEYARKAADRPKGRLDRFTKSLKYLDEALSKYDQTK